jgi:hypothetical protein
VRGFEPPAPASRTQCSTRLSYTPTEGARIAAPSAGGKALNASSSASCRSWSRSDGPIVRQICPIAHDSAGRLAGPGSQAAESDHQHICPVQVAPDLSADTRSLDCQDAPVGRPAECANDQVPQRIGRWYGKPAQPDRSTARNVHRASGRPPSGQRAGGLAAPGINRLFMDSCDNAASQS